jgi:branched-chain amino acid transport system substrate-binding protein
MWRILVLAGATLILAPGALAADKVKIGFISTLSGPNASIGGDIRDGFNLALKLAGGKAGGLPAEVLIGDDQLKPENAKQIAERFLKLERVDFITGVVFSNVVIAIAPDVFAAKVFFLAPNAGPSQYSGAQCNPFFFAASWPSEAYSEAAGQYATSKGIKNVVLLAPNYQGGKDATTGFKRYYKGRVVDEVYTKLGQLDYAAELSRIRSVGADAMYVFLPGGMGINFIKQFVAAGLSKDIQLIVPLWGSDQDIIRAVGEPMLGLFSTAHWSIDFDNAANRKFVAAFESEYKRLPTGYAASGYDTAHLIDSAVRKVKGRLEDKAALRAALQAADFRSVRGDFKFNTNQFPVQNYYLQLVGKGADGRLAHKTIGTIFSNRGDAYVQDCRMK